MHDYQENEYFLTSSDDKNLTIVFNNLAISSNKRAINARKVLRSMINFDKSNKNECVENSLLEKFKKNLDLVSSSNNSFETMLLNEIIVHDNKKIVVKIFTMMNQYLNVWKINSEFVNVSSKRWMKIKTISKTNSESFKIYKLDTEDKAIIDEKFDVLHASEKMKWASKSISYA